MGWVKLVHDCTLPTEADCAELDALPGSVWECDDQGCGRRWLLRQVDCPVRPWPASVLELVELEPVHPDLIP